MVRHHVKFLVIYCRTLKLTMNRRIIDNFFHKFLFAFVALFFLFSPLLSGGASNSQDYVEIVIPYSSQILISFYVLAIIFGLIYSKFKFNLSVVISVVFALFCYYFSSFGSLLLSRDLKFGYLILAFPSGLIFARVMSSIKFGNISLYATIIHGFFILGLSLVGDLIPGVDYILSENYLNKFDGDGSIRSSGLFLNNNTLGSSYLLMIIFTMIFADLPSSKRIILLGFYFVVLFSAFNITSLLYVVCYALLFFIKYFFRSARIKYGIILFYAFLFIMPLILDDKVDAIESKVTDSGLVKINLFLSTLYEYNYNIVSLLFGGVPGYTESTLIDLIYYFGLSLTLIFLFFMLMISVRSYSDRGKIKFHVFYVALIYLLFVQNSVFLPLNLFLFGIVLGVDLSVGAFKNPHQLSRFTRDS